MKKEINGRIQSVKIHYMKNTRARERDREKARTEREREREREAMVSLLALHQTGGRLHQAVLISPSTALPNLLGHHMLQSSIVHLVWTHEALGSHVLASLNHGKVHRKHAKSNT